jgi:deoxyribodipyrimidine photo-lyase
VAHGLPPPHAGDPRAYLYGLDDFDRGETHDGPWNAAMRDLRESGGRHDYLRMLWGKRILEWTRHPREALDIMIELNDRYALDGRDPNSYTGIFWVLGRFDRGWPERSVYGKVRSMSS